MVTHNANEITALLSNVERISPPESFPYGISFFGKALSDRISELHPNSSSPPNNADLISCFTASGMALYLNKQVHGAVVASATWDNERAEADAVIATKSELTAGRAVGVITADCVPLVLMTKNKVAVVHAGWRGLALRIISNTVQQLGEPLTHLCIGPCAGPNEYEVGQEVIDAIGSTARYTRKGQRIVLNLAATALAEVPLQLCECEVFQSGICTMSDTRFFSYRRDRERAGRNLTIVWPNLTASS